MPNRGDPFLVAAGGFAGAALRYGVEASLPGVGGTLAANVLGSFLLGVLLTAVRRPRVRVLLGTGLLSSFTTYSTFAVQTASLGPARGLANVAVTYALGFAAAVAGLSAGGRLR